MRCPKCGATDITKLDRWVRQCEKCEHRWSVTRHPERLPKPNRPQRSQS